MRPPTKISQSPDCGGALQIYRSIVGAIGSGLLTRRDERSYVTVLLQALGHCRNAFADTLSPYEAAQDLVNVVRKHRREMPDDAEFFRFVSDHLNDVFRSGDRKIQTCVITGVLEHLFEDDEIRSYFLTWRSNPETRRAFEDAIRWTEG